MKLLSRKSNDRPRTEKGHVKDPLGRKNRNIWVEALCVVDKQVEANTRLIHVFDREGDLAEVFDQVRQLQHTGVVVRAAHNRSLDQNSERLWAKLESAPICFELQIDVPATANRKARRTKLAVRFSQVNLRTPYRFDNRDPFPVYAVYATEIDCPEGEKSESLSSSRWHFCHDTARATYHITREETDAFSFGLKGDCLFRQIDFDELALLP